jgi:endonuclease-3 related protein
MSAYNSDKARGIIEILNRQFGEIPWWPGDTDEVMIGAILTQQTRWENVELALSNLKRSGLCTLVAIHTAAQPDIEEAVRCTGFYRVKAGRLKSLAAHVMDMHCGVAQMKAVPTDELRIGLLGVTGIGEETADSILCYGFFRASFVIDAYTERMARCAGITVPRSGLKSLFEGVLPLDVSAYRQAHAHIVEYAKMFCTKKRCKGCRIMTLNE